MILDLREATVDVQPIAAAFTTIAFDETSLQESSTLMVRAYRDTIDWEPGDNEAVAESEISATLQNAYGNFLAELSFTVLDAAGTAVAQIACAHDGRRPMVLFVYVDPIVQRQGLASWLMSTVANKARELGHTEIVLYVTAGNPAQHLYTRLGFRESN
jgi:GNAT superfamily N-acetyltransferase